jgi:arsenate reductase (glutaredoxin)
MITIYHNSRCGKSREGISYLENLKKEFHIINYVENTLSTTELKSLLKKLNISAIDLVRKKENVWIDNYNTLSLDDDQIIQAMVDHPKLIERPIIVNGNKAVIGRPTEKIKEIL